MNFLSEESISIPTSFPLKSEDYPIICLFPNCYRIMLKKSYQLHCLRYHKLSAQND